MLVAIFMDINLSFRHSKEDLHGKMRMEILYYQKKLFVPDVIRFLQARMKRLDVSFIKDNEKNNI